MRSAIAAVQEGQELPQAKVCLVGLQCKPMPAVGSVLLGSAEGANCEVVLCGIVQPSRPSQAATIPFVQFL